MEEEQFRELFYQELETAVQNAEKELGRSIPRNFEVELHGPGYPVKILVPEQAFGAIWLSNKEFFAIIDVSVIRVDKQHPVIFVRVSGHKPVPFEQTFNYPSGSGPFKQMIANPIQVLDS